MALPITVTTMGHGKVNASGSCRNSDSPSNAHWQSRDHVQRAHGLRKHLTDIKWVPTDPELMHDLLQESFNLYQYPTSPQDIVEAVRDYADANYIKLLPDVNGADAAQDRRALQSGLLSLTRAMKSNTAPPAELDDASEGMAEAYRMALATATRDARTATTDASILCHPASGGAGRLPFHASQRRA